MESYLRKEPTSAIFNFEEIIKDTSLLSHIDLVKTSDEGASTFEFWGGLVNADKLNKKFKLRFQLPPHSIRTKLFTGCRVQICMADPVERVCKQTWVGITSRFDTAVGPIYSGFFDVNNELGIEKMSIIPCIRPEHIFDINIHKFQFDNMTKFGDFTDEFHPLHKKYFYEFTKEYMKIHSH